MPDAFNSFARRQYGGTAAFARESPPEFGKLSGAVTGSASIVRQLEELMCDVLGKFHPDPHPGPEVPSTVLGMADQIVRSHGRALILIEIIKELVALKQSLP